MKLIGGSLALPTLGDVARGEAFKFADVKRDEAYMMMSEHSYVSLESGLVYQCSSPRLGDSLVIRYPEAGVTLGEPG